MTKAAKRSLEDLEKSGIRVLWEVRFGEPLWRTPGKRRKVRLHHRLQGLLRIAWETIRALAIIGLGASLGPFALLWLIGAATAHSGAPRILWLAYLLLLLCGLVGLALLRPQAGPARIQLRRFLGVLAIVTLPLMMYSAAAPTALGLEGFEQAAFAQPRLVDWLMFFGFMLLDTVTLGATQALVGVASSLQPATLPAAIHTFLIRALMTGGLIWAVWTRVRDMVGARQEFSATVPELRKWLEDEHPGPEVSLHVKGMELLGTIATIPASEMATLIGADVPETSGRQYRFHRRISPRNVIASTFLFSAFASLILVLAAIQAPVDYELSSVAIGMLWLLAVPVGIVLIAIAIGFARQYVRWLRVVRRALRIQRIRLARA